MHRKAPSPSPSDRSLPPFSSSGSSMSETSTGSSATAQHSCNVNGNKNGNEMSSSAISVPNQGAPGSANASNNHLNTSNNQVPHHQLIEDEQLDSASALAVAMTNGNLNQI